MANTPITIGTGSYSRSRGAGTIGDPYVQQPEAIPGVLLRPTITIGASPDYAAGDVVGGIVELTGAVDVSGRPVELTSLAVKDAGGQAPALTFLFFRATPSGGTYTDNAALVWGSGDLANLVGAVTVASADYSTLASKSLTIKGDLGHLLDCAATSLFLVIVADAVWNAAATSDLTVAVGLTRR